MKALCGLLALVLTTLSCETETLQQLTGAVSGRVCNPMTGVAAAQTKITLKHIRKKKSFSANSDSSGVFFLGGLPEGDYSGQAQHALFTFDLEVTIEGNKTTTWTDAGCRELALPAGTGELVGQICNRHVGQFVSDAVIRVLLPDGQDLSTNSDGQGNFVLSQIPEGVHVVYVTAAGYSRSHQVAITADQQTLLETQGPTCTPPDPSTTGKIVGTICADELGEQPIAGVRLYLTEAIEGYTFEDVTADDGSFVIAGVPAPRVVSVRAERGGFSASFADVQVYPLTQQPDGTEITLHTCSPLIPDPSTKYLVVNGYYDKIQHVLGRMELADITVVEGNPLDPGQLWAAEIFGDFATLVEYDAVFVNCGAAEHEFLGTPDPVVAENLRAYVQNGGSIYVSDQAYDLVETVWPGRIDFLFTDADNSAAEYGVDGVYQTQVEDPGLREFVGAAQIDIDFNFGYFALIKEVAVGTTVYLRADMQYYVNNTIASQPDTPITVAFTDGQPGIAGRVVFTSFHQESDAITGEPEQLDGPEDAVLQYLVFEL